MPFQESKFKEVFMSKSKIPHKVIFTLCAMELEFRVCSILGHPPTAIAVFLSSCGVTMEYSRQPLKGDNLLEDHRNNCSSYHFVIDLSCKALEWILTMI